MHTEIRTAQPRDLPAVSALAGEIWREHYPGIITRSQIDYMLNRDYATEKLQDDLRTGIRFELLFVDQTLAGFAAFGSTMAIEGNPGAGFLLHKLYLRQSFHGRGVGSMLLRHIIDECRQTGAGSLSLYVNKHNRQAIRSYQRQGFETVASVLNAIGDGFFMDDYVMSLRL